MSDFIVSCDGSLGLVSPKTKGAREYLTEHVPADSQWFGSSLVVEPRYLSDLVAGLRQDGFAVVFT